MTLPKARTEDGRRGLQAIIDKPDRALIALDFDGTLSPIVPDPATSRMVDGGGAVLTRLAGLVGQLAIVTGRAALTVVELGGLASIGGILVEGQYGAQRWSGGVLTSPEPLPGIPVVSAALPGVLESADPAVWVEDKGLSLVVHTRRAADPEAELDRLAPPLKRLAARAGLEANGGRNVIEIRPPGIDKGGALRRLVGEFDPAAVLFAGDDVGDLPAFGAIEHLRGEGTPGVTVCAASAEAPQIAAFADIVVEGPTGVVTLLESISAELERP